MPYPFRRICPNYSFYATSVLLATKKGRRIYRCKKGGKKLRGRVTKNVIKKTYAENLHRRKKTWSYLGIVAGGGFEPPTFGL